MMITIIIKIIMTIIVIISIMTKNSPIYEQGEDDV